MNSLRAVPLVLLSLALPVCAQRGGARGSVAGHAAAPAARTAFAPSARSGFPAAGATAPAARYGAALSRNPGSSQRSLFPPPGVTSTRPVFYSNGIRRYGSSGRYGQGRTGYGGVGYGLGGLVYPGYPGYLDFGYPADYDAFDPLDPNNAPDQYPQNSAQDAFVNAPAEPTAAPGDAGNGGAYYYGEPGQAPQVPYTSQPEPGARYDAPARPPAAPLPEEDAVTLVFKDGRPNEQIRNYALTRTTLYVTAGRVRSIPIAEIDTAATEKANQKAGVEFQLPSTK